MPRIIPDPRYFSIPSSEVGAEVFRNLASELLAVGAIVDPFTRSRDPLAGRNRSGLADNRNQFAMTSCLDPQNAEAVLVIVERDALDQTGQNLLSR